MTDLDLEEVRAARAREQDRVSLVDLGDPTVFDRVQEAVDENEIEREQAIQLATELADERAGKLLKLASLKAAGLTVNCDGATDDERELVEDLVARLGEWRASIIPETEEVADGAE